MHVQPYLYFDGRTEEAVEFYKTAVGAKVEALMRWTDSPDKSMCTPNTENKIMHGSIHIGDANVLVSDGRNSGNPKFDGFALTISTKTEAEAIKIFEALAAGGKVTMPQTKTFFSARFGMVVDKFGVTWNVLVAQ
jgi:PhnB protein